MKCYEHFFGLKFQVTGRNLTVDNTNELLKRFRDKLNDFELEKGTLKVNVIYPDDITFENAKQINNGMMEGNYSGIRMNIVDDVGEPAATVRFNDVVRPEIGQALQAIKLKRYNVKLRVVSVSYR